MSSRIRLFQYPQADRRGCNRLLSLWSAFSSRVSVSTSGSKGVQLPSLTTARLGSRSFSIHKRIEGGATHDDLPVVVDDAVFQYPQADRRGCNYCTSTGSAPMQRAFQYPQADRRGCNWRRCCRSATKSCRFSIHKRIEGGATLGTKQQAMNSRRFQYPQADRRGCN